MEWFHAPSGNNIRRDFDLRTGTVRFRLLEDDGTTPVAQRKVRFFFAGDHSGECGSGTTDDTGWLELPPMPSARLVPRVEVQGALDLEPFAVTEGTGSEVLRKLPAKQRTNQ
jgi:hypothetical protein